MKLLFIGPLPPPMTGHSLACQVFLNSLRKKHEVELVDLAKSTLVQGISSLSRIREVLSYAWQAKKKSKNCDCVYFTISQSVTGNFKDLLIYLACWSKLPRMVIHLHGGPGMAALLSDRHRIIRRLNAAVLRRVGGVVVLGPRHVSIYEPFVNGDRIKVVYNFAEDEFFLDEERIRQKFHDQGPLRVLFLSNMIQGKGYLELLESLRLLKPEAHARVAVDFAGKFETSTQEREFLRDIEDDPRVTYHGVVTGEKKAELLSRAHVLCLPSYHRFGEGQPISILEAYAAGCAVITTNHGGIFDVFTPGINGYAVEKQSPSSIADAIEAAMSDRTRLMDFALANRRQAGLHYSVGTFNGKLMSIMEAIACTNVVL